MIADRLENYREPGFYGFHVGRRYFKWRDVRRHPLRYTERNRLGYRRLVRLGSWELGVR